MSLLSIRKCRILTKFPLKYMLLSPYKNVEFQQNCPQNILYLYKNIEFRQDSTQTISLSPYKYVEFWQNSPQNICFCLPTKMLNFDKISIKIFAFVSLPNCWILTKFLSKYFLLSLYKNVEFRQDSSQNICLSLYKDVEFWQNSTTKELIVSVKKCGILTKFPIK